MAALAIFVIECASKIYHHFTKLNEEDGEDEMTPSIRINQEYQPDYFFERNTDREYDSDVERYTTRWDNWDIPTKSVYGGYQKEEPLTLIPQDYSFYFNNENKCTKGSIDWDRLFNEI